MNLGIFNREGPRHAPQTQGAHQHSIVAAALMGLSLLAAMPASAAPRTWSGTSSTNWSDGVNWGGTVPGDGDAVVVPNTGTKPSMASGTYPASGAFLSFEVQAGAIVTCLGDTNAINAPSGGIAALKHGTGVAINCQSALINGTLSADQNGFNSGIGFGGPGCSIAQYGCGGTYGGRGAGLNVTPYYASLNSYGSLTQPTALGSSGYNTAGGGSWAGQGGGAIRLNVTGALTLNGTVTACGRLPPGNDSSGGSGGSIWLTCDTFQGNGVIKANGGTSSANNKGGGGGGRVALEYNSSTFSGAVSVSGGGILFTGQPGTLWEPKRFPDAVANIVITNSYQYFFPATAANYTWGLTLTNGVAVYFHDFTNGTLTFTNLLVTGGSTLRFDVDSTSAGGKIGINNLAITGSVTVAATSRLYVANCLGGFTSLVVSGASICDFSLCTNSFPALQAVAVTEAGSYLNFGTWMSLPSLNSILMTTNTTLYLPSQTYTLTGDLAIPTGAVLYAQSNTNAVNPSSGGTVGNPHGAGVTINCQNALINGILYADLYGFNAGIGFGGPGCATALYGCGGTYGGLGAGLNVVPYYSSSPAYGSLTQPTALGSSGYNTGGGSWAGQGGGAIRLTAAGALTLNGTVTAGGTLGNNSSGGSGGSIWLACTAFQGSGVVWVNGGISGAANKGGGGGGRVALEYASSTFSGAVSVAGGGGANNPGLTGTVFLCQSPWTGTATTNGVNGKRLDTQFSVSSNNVKIARAITRFDTSLKWSDLSTTVSNNSVVTNTAIYTISGLRPSRGYAVYWDGTNQFGGQLFTSTNGMLTFTNTLNMLRNFLVMPAERGTIMTVY